MLADAARRRLQVLQVRRAVEAGRRAHGDEYQLGPAHGRGQIGGELQAIMLGEVTYLNATEAAKAAAVNDTQLARVWELWARNVGPVE